MNAQTELLKFLNNELPFELSEGLALCFNKDMDPEVSWESFRLGLRRLKKKHLKLYDNYMESDEEDLPKSDYAKFRDGES